MTDNREMIEQLRSVFFEEAEDGLAIMETGLLRLDEGVRDPELINSIFRAAHSIKGGSGTFGFSEMIDFTHHVETLLDRMRSGDHPIDGATVSVLLRSVDHLRVMLVSAMNGEETDPNLTLEVQAEVESLLETEGDASDKAPAEKEEEADGTLKRYVVTFEPAAELMKTGNDPALILRELQGFGEAKTTVDLSALPDLDTMDPESFYMSFTIELETEKTVDEIKDVFMWVEDEAKVTVKAIATEESKEKAVAPESPPAVESAAPTAAPESRAAAAPEPAARPSGNKSLDAGSIRVGIEKIDALINLVGELVITQSMLGQIEKTFDMSKLDRLRDGLSELERNTRQLQESVMRIRMLPIRFVFSRFPRMVRDLSQRLDKQVKLTLAGEGTELDKTVMEKIGDPLVHLVRNALDHGLESP